jgi:predicted Zn-dependent protease
MKHVIFAVALTLSAAPASAQFGGLIDKAQKAKKTADTLEKTNFSEKEEQQLGEEVSALVVDRFGVYQDKEVTKYVTLVGTVLAQASERPNLPWQFIVLDTDGVNAYAAPGGYIHITKGALGLIRNEAELAGVLGHEIAHVTERHTINAIKKSSWTELGVEAGASQAPGGGLAQTFISAAARKVYNDLFENAYDRSDENESDEEGIKLANKVGYAPTGMIGFLTKLAERNKDQKEPNGIFASHPQLKDRISKMEQQIKKEKLTSTALVAARYAERIKIEAAPLTAINMSVDGVRGAVGDNGEKPKEEAKKEEPKKSGGFGLSKLGLSKSSQAQNTQTVASAGSRGVRPDRDAVGGPNKNKLKVPLTPAEVAEFKKGIAA